MVLKQELKRRQGKLVMRPRAMQCGQWPRGTAGIREICESNIHLRNPITHFQFIFILYYSIYIKLILINLFIYLFIIIIIITTTTTTTIIIIIIIIVIIIIIIIVIIISVCKLLIIKARKKVFNFCKLTQSSNSRFRK